MTIRMRWWTKSDRGTVVKIFSEVLAKTQHAMDEAKIDLPFPTMVQVRNAHDIQEAQEREDDKRNDDAVSTTSDEVDSQASQNKDTRGSKGDNGNLKNDSELPTDTVENKENTSEYEEKLKKRNEIDGNEEV